MLLCLHSSQRQEEAGRAQGRALHHSHCKCAVGFPLVHAKDRRAVPVAVPAGHVSASDGSLKTGSSFCR